MYSDNEAKRFDCSRGCAVERTDEGELICTYRQGCCKQEVYNWLSGVRQEQFKDYFEVRFKNTRKGIYINTSGQYPQRNLHKHFRTEHKDRRPCNRRGGKRA